ncbi:RICIN domain-containing protein [Streptomyces sp. MS1.HAVA.3]|uniref:RICIN domain-containing protein n=1 Tax=Streptomyces caledonius TaxID=3134107 RepID=A0ABU8TX80_9ACTN
MAHQNEGIVLLKMKYSRTLGRFSAVCALIMGLLGINLVTAESASADYGWFQFKNVGTSQCMHASSGGGAGAWVTQEWCRYDEMAQRWTWGKDSQGRWILVNWQGKCLDSYNGQNPGTVIVWTCNGADSQTWNFGSNPGMLEPRGGAFLGRAIEPPGEAVNPGAQLIMWPLNATIFQRWVLYIPE